MVSINTNTAAKFAQQNIELANNQSASSVARLSSGNRIVKASDDVAALAIGTSLSTQISALRSALTSASQGTSLLQVADGGLKQIVNILQQQKSIAQQAASGSLTATDRGFLDQQFQALTQQISSLTASTTFNGVTLLNGSLESAAAVANATSFATGSTASITFNNTIVTGESVIINGITFSAGATSADRIFQVAGDIAGTVANLASRLNAYALTTEGANALGDVIFEADGQTLRARSRTGGELSETFRISTAATSSQLTGNIVTTGVTTSVTVTLNTAAEAANYQVGQTIIVNNVTDAAVDSIAANALRGVITDITNGVITFTAQGAAGGGASTAITAGAYIIADTADYNAEGTTTGGTQSVSFNLFSEATNIIAADQVVVAATPTATSPFDAGQALQITANGVTSTLYTYVEGATLEQVVNGINANSGSTGYTASLIRDTATNTYNIRITKQGEAAVLRVDAGTNFLSSADLRLTGENISDTTGFVVDSAGTGLADQTVSIINSGSLNVVGTAADLTITAANATASVVGTSGDTGAGSPFDLNDTITLELNGRLLTLVADLEAADTLTTIRDKINASQDAIDNGIRAEIVGTDGGFNLRIYVASPNTAADYVNVDGGANIDTLASNTATVLNTTVGTQTGLSINTVTTLNGAADDGLGYGSVVASGSSGDSLITALNQQNALVTVALTQAITAGQTITIAGTIFQFTANTNGASNEVLIGANNAETLDNLVSVINRLVADGNATGSTAYELNQLNITRSGTSLIIEGRSIDTVTTVSGAASGVSTNITGASVSSSTLDNGAASNSGAFGVDVQGVANSAFAGTLSGFTATYVSDGVVDISITVGDYTYTAQNVNVTSASNTRVRFFSDGANGAGGYFDIQLRGGENANLLEGQEDAFAARLDAAFSTITFTQNRVVSSYNGVGNIVVDSTSIGSLLGTSVNAQLSSFDALTLTDISVSAPSGSNTDLSISLVINGETFTTATGIGSTLGANQTYRLVSASDPNQFVEFTTGNTTIVVDSAAKAAAFESALRTAFNFNADAAALTFQVGATAADVLSVSIGSATADDLQLTGLSITTQQGANAANAVLDTAISAVTALRAGVGALQSRLEFASAAIQIGIQNQDAARAQLQDTDIAAESTNFATAQVKLQAGISVLAQANQQLQALLKLIG